MSCNTPEQEPDEISNERAFSYAEYPSVAEVLKANLERIPNKRDRPTARQIAIALHAGATPQDMIGVTQHDFMNTYTERAEEADVKRNLNGQKAYLASLVPPGFGIDQLSQSEVLQEIHKRHTALQERFPIGCYFNMKPHEHPLLMRLYSQRGYILTFCVDGLKTQFRAAHLLSAIRIEGEFDSLAALLPAFKARLRGVVTDVVKPLPFDVDLKTVVNLITGKVSRPLEKRLISDDPGLVTDDVIRNEINAVIERLRFQGKL